MFAIHVELLTGRYAATRFNDRTAIEWPPHPARLFSALVATWADADVPDQAEREALAWLESLGAPEIAASAAATRSPVTHFVPNNEAGGTVVADLSSNYQKLAAIEAEQADAHRRLALDPADKTAQKDANRLGKAATKLGAKIRSDSARASATKPKDSDEQVRKAVQLLPDERGKQGRVFPVAIPIDPAVVFSWPQAEPSDNHRQLLDLLLARVARLGHSSSMVSCTISEDAGEITLVPGDDGVVPLRVTSAGLLDELELAYASHRGNEPRVLPTVLSPYRAQRRVLPEQPCPFLGDDWIILTDTGTNKLPLFRTLDLTIAARAALLRHADDPIPEILSGHQPGGGAQKTRASERPHLAVVALPFVGHRHADGNIRGLGLLLPRESTTDERAALAKAVRSWVEDGGGKAIVMLGRSGVRRLDVGDQLAPLAALRPDTWCRPSARWVSVTPMALDRFPGELWNPQRRKHEAAERRVLAVISDACTHVGLPRPAMVEVDQAGLLAGVPHLRRFPAYRSPGRKVLRMAVHARLTFDDPVRGPVLIGAGRYFGYGLFRPTAGDAETRVPVAKAVV